VIEVDGLRKSYGDFLAVDGVSFTAEAGKIFGLLGPNGAGKSTAIGCISGLLQPSDGRIRVNGHDVVKDSRAAKESLGVVPQELSLYEEVSATENLLFWGAAYGLRGAELKSRVHDVLAYTGLLDRAKEPVKNYSGGMKRRINFGCAIMHRPKVLLLDEPTVGVDPQSRVRLFEMVKEQVDQGTAVLYTTHYMQEAEQLCDELAIIDHGKLIADGTLDELRGMVGEKDILRLAGSFDPEQARTALSSLPDVQVVAAEDDSVRLSVADASRRLPELFDAITRTGGEVRETTLSQPSLETLFLKLTGKELRK
jgi:linearmycin/streptolysin S transport system ATP-binding protein